MSLLLSFQEQQAVASPELGHACWAHGFLVSLTVQDQKEATDESRTESWGPNIPSRPGRTWLNKEGENEGNLGSSAEPASPNRPVLCYYGMHSGNKGICQGVFPEMCHSDGKTACIRVNEKGSKDFLE